jgi:hypothetical protein
MTAAELIEQRASLIEARSGGITKVVFHSGGTRREVEFRSMADIIAAIAAIDRDLAGLNGRRIHTFTPAYSRGFE